MNNIQKIKAMFAVSAVSTVLATALKTLAMYKEYDPEIGFFATSSPLDTAANAVLCLSLLFFIVMSFTFKKRELFPVINYQSSFFRFFSSTSGCLMLVYAYVKWGEYLTEKASLIDANAKKTAFLFLMVILSLASAAALMVYAFAKNETNSPKRAFLAFLPAAVIMVRSIEIQFDGNIEMNNPLKIFFQSAGVVLMLAIVYLAKCEFEPNETTPRMRLITLMAAPVFVCAFALTTVICYYTKHTTVFSYLVDSVLYISLCGFVVSSYTPCKQAKPICDAKWSAYDDAVALLNMPVSEDDPEEEIDSAEENLTETDSDNNTDNTTESAEITENTENAENSEDINA